MLGNGTRTQADKVRTRTRALLEHPGVYEQLSTEDNLEFYGRIWRMPAAERQARIKELLTHIGVWEQRKERVGTWSKGMKQKLARAMLHRPPLVFLDEPTAGLDVVAAAAVRDDLETLAAREGVTVFLTTHNSPRGVAFGWLYWKQSLESVILAHFMVDAVGFVAVVPACLSGSFLVHIAMGKVI
ncbi:MAG: ATP-binding cassette domain-containing protein [Anaerolineae bacterium]